MTAVAWDELTPTGAPATTPLVEETSADVVVIGLGASGLTACHHLARRGADVVGLDAVGIAAGAAGRNGGFLLAGGSRFHHDAVATWGRERAVALHRATEDELHRTVDALPSVALLGRAGSLRIAEDDVELEDIGRQLDAMRADGLDVEPYEGPEGRGLLVPGDAAIDPVARARYLAGRATDAGARLHAPARVVDVPTADHVAVATPGGAIRVTARAFVVAVDGGLERLLPDVGHGVRSTRLQMLATAPETAVQLSRPVYRRWGYDYAQQTPDRRILLGGCRDRFAEDEWGAPPEPTAAIQGCLEDELVRLGVTAPVTHRWAAIAAFTDDGWPVCERHGERVLVVGGYSGHGNLIGTMAGRRAADAALDGTDLHLL